MSQMPVGQAKSLLEKAGYSVRMSRKRQGRLIVARGKQSASLVVLQGAVSQEGSGDCSNWRRVSIAKWLPIDRSDCVTVAARSHAPGTISRTLPLQP